MNISYYHIKSSILLCCLTICRHFKGGIKRNLVWVNHQIFAKTTQKVVKGILMRFVQINESSSFKMLHKFELQRTLKINKFLTFQSVTFLRKSISYK